MSLSNRAALACLSSSSSVINLYEVNVIIHLQGSSGTISGRIQEVYQTLVLVLDTGDSNTLDSAVCYGVDGLNVLNLVAVLCVLNQLALLQIRQAQLGIIVSIVQGLSAVLAEYAEYQCVIRVLILSQIGRASCRERV